MIPSPEKQAICLAAEAVSQTPESFMLSATLVEARRVLKLRIRELHRNGETETALHVEDVLAAIQTELVTNI